MYTVLDIIHAADTISDRVAAEASLDHPDELSPADRAESMSAKSRVSSMPNIKVTLKADHRI